MHLITFGEKDVLNCLWRVRNTLACGERCTSCNCFGESKIYVLLPVERGVLNCLLRNIILCTLAYGEKDFFL